jgi:hypothetical protein
VIRTEATLAFAAERQVVRQTARVTVFGGSGVNCGMRRHRRQAARWSAAATLLLSVAACSQRVPDLSAHELLRFERTVCFGECPAYKVDLFEDGHLQYAGSVAVAIPGPAEVWIATPAMAKIRSSIQRLSELKADCCNCYDSTDSPSVNMTFRTRGGKEPKKIDHYHGCEKAPDWLYEMENSIDELLDTERWVGRQLRYRHHH